MRKTLVILNRNEINGLKALFDKIPKSEVDEVMAIDYRSTDGSREFLIEKAIKVIDQVKKGRGEAMRLAIMNAKGDGVCFWSPDGNEDPADIPKLLKLIEDGYDLAVASRFMPASRNEEDESFLPLRAWANRAFTMLANLFFRGKMTDSINGFRAVRKQSFSALNLDADGYAIEYQMSIRSMKKKYRITELATIEGNRIGGESMAKSIPTGLKILRILLREAFLGKKVFNARQ